MGSFGFYPQWKTWAWRLLRGVVATAFAQTVIYVCGNAVADPTQLFTCAFNAWHRWTDPKTALTMIAASFISGLLMALGVAIRDYVAANDKSHPINKLPF